MLLLYTTLLTNISVLKTKTVNETYVGPHHTKRVYEGIIFVSCSRYDGKYAEREDADEKSFPKHAVSKSHKRMTETKGSKKRTS